MDVIFGSIVVDPFVFYAVLTGILLVLFIIIILMIRSKVRRRNKVLEPITITGEEQLSDSDRIDITTINKEETNKANDLSTMLNKMEEEIKTIKEEKVIDTFERMQEEKAIISYKELLQKKDELKEEIHVNKVSIEPIETINIEIPAVKNNDELVKRFRTSDIISPVFGKVDDNTVYPEIKPLEKPIKHEELVSEPARRSKPVSSNIKDGEDFLEALKDFRKNLE